VLVELYDWNERVAKYGNAPALNSTTTTTMQQQQLRMASPPVLAQLALRVKDKLLEAHKNSAANGDGEDGEQGGEPFLLDEKEVKALQSFTASISWAKKFIRNRQWNKGVGKLKAGRKKAAIAAMSSSGSSSADGVLDESSNDNGTTRLLQQRYRQQQQRKQQYQLAVQDYLARVREIRDNVVVPEYPDPDRVYMMDETDLYYGVLPCRSYVLRTSVEQHEDDGTVTGDDNGDELLVPSNPFMTTKRRVSLMVCANESGSDKLPVAVVSSDKEHNDCFVHARQVVLPLFYADDSTNLKRWFNLFLTHVRNQTSDKVLLLLNTNAKLVDPLGQVRVEWLRPPPPPPPYSTHVHLSHPMRGGGGGTGISSQLKRKYRYALLLRILKILDEIPTRRELAASANLSSQGLEEGQAAHLRNVMDILNEVWQTSDTTRIIQAAWNRSGIRDSAPQSLVSSLLNDSATNGDDTTRMILEILNELPSFEQKKEAEAAAAAVRNDQPVEGKSQLDVCLDELYATLLSLTDEEGAAKELLDEWVALEESQQVVEMNQQDDKIEYDVDKVIDRLVQGQVTKAWSEKGRATEGTHPDKQDKVVPASNIPGTSVSSRSSSSRALDNRCSSAADPGEIHRHVKALLTASSHFASLGSPEYRDVAVSLRDCVEQVRRTYRTEEAEEKKRQQR